jgi:hypothetical protein
MIVENDRCVICFLLIESARQLMLQSYMLIKSELYLRYIFCPTGQNSPITAFSRSRK